MATPGAKGKLNAELIETISAALSNGLTRETAVKYARVSYQSFYNWMTRGKAEFERISKGEKAPRADVKREKIYLELFNKVETAEADAIVGWQDTINKAARLDPIWAFKMASLRDRGYHSVDITATLDLSKATDEQLERISNGENPLTAMANSGPGAARTAPTAEPADG